MPQTHVLKTDQLQDYLDRIPPGQKDHPVTQMLQKILNETYASGYPDTVKLINHNSVVSATLWTDEDLRLSLIKGDVKPYSEHVKKLRTSVAQDLGTACQTAGAQLLKQAVSFYRKTLDAQY